MEIAETNRAKCVAECKTNTNVLVFYPKKVSIIPDFTLHININKLLFCNIDNKDSIEGL